MANIFHQALDVGFWKVQRLAGQKNKLDRFTVTLNGSSEWIWPGRPEHYKGHFVLLSRKGKPGERQGAKLLRALPIGWPKSSERVQASLPPGEIPDVVACASHELDIFRFVVVDTLN